MLKLWNFSSTLGRPNSEEKERKRRLREAQLTQIQKELTLDRKLITGPSWRSSNQLSKPNQQPQRAKTFRHTGNGNALTPASNVTSPNTIENGLSTPGSRAINDVRQNNYNNLRFRSKSSHKLDEDSQFVSRLRFFDDRSGLSSNPSNPLQIKRHSSAFLTPGDDEEMNPRPGPDLYGMRRRYTTAFDSEDTDFTASTSGGGGGHGFSDHRGNMVTFDTSKNSSNKMEQRLRFSDQADMSTTSGTNRSSYGGTSDDGFGDYRSDNLYLVIFFCGFIY